MRTIGISTGALAFSDFRRALGMIRDCPIEAIELSALRQPELFPLLEALDTLDIARFRYIAIHAPSQLSPESKRP